MQTTLRREITVVGMGLHSGRPARMVLRPATTGGIRFRRVDVTRPAASRQVSAEIFAVCQGYLAPKKIDPKLFDPTVVFRPTTLESDAQQAAKTPTSLFGQARDAHPNRSGYTTDKQFIFETATVSEFVEAANPAPVLARSHALVWDADSEIYRQHKATTKEIEELIKDKAEV